MKRVVIDARMIGPTPHGFSRYVTFLLRALSRIENKPYEVLALRSESSPWEAFEGIESATLNSRFLSPREWLEIPRALRKLGADLFHSPTFASLPACPCPWIVTVHDLNHLKFGDWKEKLYYQLILRRFARKAHALVTVSEFSRREISRWLGIVESRIDLAFNALDPKLSERPAELQERLSRQGLKEGGFLFCLANSKPHKNVEVLLKAYELYRERVTNPLSLVLNYPVHRSGVVSLDGPSDLDIQALIHGASAVIAPSLYEGFGLPPVEALAAGTPVVASRIPPHQESLGQEGVLWVEHPAQADDWSDALERLHHKPLERPGKHVSSRILQKYSAPRLGENMDSIYRRVLGREQ